MDWKGIKVTVKLSVVNRVVSSFIIPVFSFLFARVPYLCIIYQATPSIIPTAAAMVLRELKETPRDRKKVKNVTHGGNITLDAVISIARTMRIKSMAKKLEGTVLEVLGTAFSIGCKVNGSSPYEIQEQIKAGSITIPEE